MLSTTHPVIWAADNVWQLTGANGATILAPDITSPSAVTVLGTANCTDASGNPAACAPIAQTTGTSFPWAIRSANLTYVGEVPFSYISEADRYVAFSDLLFPALAPAATPSHLALVRLEDVDPTADPAALMQFADYLYSQHVLFSVGVIPEYTDPHGYYNGGKKQTITLAQEPALVAAPSTCSPRAGRSSSTASPISSRTSPTRTTG